MASGDGRRSAPARAAVQHVAEVLRDLGVRVPVAEHFRLAKFDDAEAAASMLTLAHDLIALDAAGALGFDGVAAADRKRAALTNAAQGAPPAVLLGVVQWGVLRRGYRRTSFARMLPHSLGARELLLAVGWLVGRLQVLDLWVAAAASALWRSPDRRHTLLTHYDDDIGSPVAPPPDDDAHPRASDESARAGANAKGARGRSTEPGRPRSTQSRPSTTSSERLNPVDSARAVATPQLPDTLVDQLRQHTSAVGGAKYAVRALAGELVGRVKRAHTVRTDAPTWTPAQLYLLCHPELHDRYGARLSLAIAQLRDVLAAEEEHHPAWWRWMQSLLEAADAAAGETSPEIPATPARQRLFSALEPRRDALSRANRSWITAQTRMRQDIVRAERELARVASKVLTAAASSCGDCRRQTHPDSPLPIVCSCVFEDVSQVASPVTLHGCRKTVHVPKGRPGGVGPKGTDAISLHTVRLEDELRTLEAEVKLAAKANSDLLQLLLAKAPKLVLVH